MSSLQSLLKAFSSASSAKQSGGASTEAKPQPTARPPATAEILRAIDSYQSEWAGVDKQAFLGESSSEIPEEKSLAVLFIIIDKFPNESLWKLWQRDAERENAKVTFYFHAKHPEHVKSEFVRSRLVRSFQLKPEWGSVDLTKTMLLMLREAWAEDSSTQKFVFASESCVPLLPLQEVLNSIYADGAAASWLRYLDKANNGFAQQQQWDVLEASGLQPGRILKADQWLLLSRAHVTWLFSFLRRILSPQLSEKDGSSSDTAIPVSALRSHPIFRLFHSVRASDEVFFPTLFALMMPRKQDAPVQQTMDEVQVYKRRASYCDWHGMARNPKTFNLLDQGVMRPALEEGCIFFRKLQLDDKTGRKVEDLAEDETADFRCWWEKVYGNSPAQGDDRPSRKRQREER